MFSVRPSDQFNASDINVLEILAIAEAFNRFGDKWRYCKVYVYTDNTSAYSALLYHTPTYYDLCS